MLAERMQVLPARLLAGISGGADSVALLYMLRERGIQVTAVHVNHGLRGEASDGDEAFVRELCENWHIPLRVFRADPPENPGEDWARQARYGFFRQAAEETGVRIIALAHHRDDQAETLLLHLLRGAGLTGLQGMAADATVDGLRILRPLLSFSRDELRALLVSARQPWREDASNTDPRYLRNALRTEIIPRMEALLPGVSERLANTAFLLQGDEAVLDGMTKAFLLQNGGEDYLPLAALRAQPEAMRRRILRAWWQTHGALQKERSLSAAQTAELTGLLDAPAGARCNLPQGWFGQRGWTHLHLVSGETMPAIAETPLSECPLLRIEPAEGRMGDGKTAQAFPKSSLEGLVVRTRRREDWISPFGSGCRQSLQDYLVNRHVDAPFRDRVPLVCRGSEVLLAGGVGAGGVPRMKNDTDSVLLCWTTAFPWHDT